MKVSKVFWTMFMIQRSDDITRTTVIHQWGKPEMKAIIPVIFENNPADVFIVSLLRRASLVYMLPCSSFVFFVSHPITNVAFMNCETI